MVLFGKLSALASELVDRVQEVTTSQWFCVQAKMVGKISANDKQRYALVM